MTADANSCALAAAERGAGVEGREGEVVTPRGVGSVEVVEAYEDCGGDGGPRLPTIVISGGSAPARTITAACRSSFSLSSVRHAMT